MSKLSTNLLNYKTIQTGPYKFERIQLPATHPWPDQNSVVIRGTYSPVDSTGRTFFTEKHIYTILLEDPACKYYVQDIVRLMQRDLRKLAAQNEEHPQLEEDEVTGEDEGME